MATVHEAEEEDEEGGHGTLDSRSDRDLADFDELSDFQSSSIPEAGSWWVARVLCRVCSMVDTWLVLSLLQGSGGCHGWQWPGCWCCTAQSGEGTPLPQLPTARVAVMLAASRRLLTGSCWPCCCAGKGPQAATWSRCAAALAARHQSAPPCQTAPPATAMRGEQRPVQHLAPHPMARPCQVGSGCVVQWCAMAWHVAATGCAVGWRAQCCAQCAVGCGLLQLSSWIPGASCLASDLRLHQVQPVPACQHVWTQPNPS